MDRRNDFLNYLNNRFGTSVDARMRKLEEEFYELKDAASKDISKSRENLEDFVDELADLNGVLFHIAGILGYSQDDLMKMCSEKIKGRESNPDYKRKHPHHSGICKMKNQLVVLQEVAKTYPTSSIGNIITQIGDVIKNKEKKV